MNHTKNKLYNLGRYALIYIPYNNLKVCPAFNIKPTNDFKFNILHFLENPLPETKTFGNMSKYYAWYITKDHVMNGPE